MNLLSTKFFLAKPHRRLTSGEPGSRLRERRPHAQSVDKLTGVSHDRPGKLTANVTFKMSFIPSHHTGLYYSVNGPMHGTEYYGDVEAQLFTR